MTTIGEQLVDSINRFKDIAGKEASIYMAEQIASRMKENTASGRAFGNDDYDPDYVKSYRKKREREGLSTKPVIMRAKKKRIEKTEVIHSKSGAVIQLTDKDVIHPRSQYTFPEVMKMHQEGRAKGGKIRSFYPQEASSVPADLIKETSRLYLEKLSGSK